MKGLAVYVLLAQRTEMALRDAFQGLVHSSATEGEIPATARLLASWSDDHAGRLQPARDRLGDAPSSEPERLTSVASGEARSGPVGLLRDLQEVHLLAALADTTWTVVLQGARGAGDTDLEAVALHCHAETLRQLSWLMAQMKQIAPQALLAAEPAGVPS